MHVTLKAWGDFDEPHFKGHRRLVTTLPDSAALESRRKIQWGWWKLKRNIWASVGAARWLIKLISTLSPPTPPQHIINTALVFCEPLPLPSISRTRFPHHCCHFLIPSLPMSGLSWARQRKDACYCLSQVTNIEITPWEGTRSDLGGGEGPQKNFLDRLEMSKSKKNLKIITGPIFTAVHTNNTYPTIKLLSWWFQIIYPHKGKNRFFCCFVQIVVITIYVAEKESQQKDKI